MKLKFIIGSVILLLTITSCVGGLIYTVRGPKYKGKFDNRTYSKELDSTSYYVNREVKSEEEYVNHGVFYTYLKFNNNGILYMNGSKDRLFSKDELSQSEMIENYYVFKNGSLRWEIYIDSYNGSQLYKAKVYNDSIIAWERGLTKKYVKTYYKID